MVKEEGDEKKLVILNNKMTPSCGIPTI